MKSNQLIRTNHKVSSIPLPWRLFTSDPKVIELLLNQHKINSLIKTWGNMYKIKMIIFLWRLWTTSWLRWTGTTMWCWWKELSPRSNLRQNSKISKEKSKQIETSPKLKAREWMTLWRHLGQNLSTNWEYWGKNSNKRLSSCVRTTVLNLKTPRIDLID